MKTTKKMSKLLAVGLLGLVLALGVTLVGCGEHWKCPNDGNCSGTSSVGCDKSGCAANKESARGTAIKCDC